MSNRHSTSMTRSFFIVALLLAATAANAFNLSPWDHSTAKTADSDSTETQGDNASAQSGAVSYNADPSYTTPWRVGPLSFREKRDLEAVCRQEFPFVGAGRSLEARKATTTTQTATATTPSTSVSATVGPVDVSLPAIGLTLGNITTKIGNINLTVDTIVISAGDIEISDVHIGNISVIVSVPLPGQGAATPFQAFKPGTTMTGSTSSPASSSFMTGTTVSKSATTIRRRQADDTSAPTDLATNPPATGTVTVTTTPAPTSGSGGGGVGGGVSVGGATVSSNPIDIGAGSIDTEIGNVTISVHNVNVTIGSITLKNITIGNVFVLVQIGQPDLGGLVNTLDNVRNETQAIGSS